jgi:hypothetical protein
MQNLFGKRKGAKRVWWGNLRKRDNFEDIRVYRNNIL